MGGAPLPVEGARQNQSPDTASIPLSPLAGESDSPEASGERGPLGEAEAQKAWPG
jgi:hypothetical protein